MWDCGKCLAFGHSKSNCNNKVRCRGCFHYGHVRMDCHKDKSKQRWVPKRNISDQSPTGDVSVSLDTESLAHIDPLLETSPVLPPLSLTVPNFKPAPTPNPTSPPRPESSSPTMVNFELDPAYWMPQGHQVIDGGPTRLPRSFYLPSTAPPRRHDHIIVGAPDRLSETPVMHTIHDPRNAHEST
jgi:hypothetical protein